MILLTDEEIEVLEEDCFDCHGHNELLVARTQLKKVVERFESEFPKMVGLKAQDIIWTGLWRTLKKEAGI